MFRANMSVLENYVNKRVIRKACEKHFRVQTPFLIHALVDFIQNGTPSDRSEKYLTNPHKNLLYAITGASNVTKKGFIELINEIDDGPLARKWIEAINQREDNQAEEYDVGASFGSRNVPVEIGDITFPDVSLDIQEEIRNLKGTVKEINKSLVEQSMREQSMKERSTSTPRRHLTRQKNIDELDKSYLEEPDFKNVLSSTIDTDLVNAIDVFWRVRDGNLDALQKVTVPKMPPKNKYPVRHHFLTPEPVQRQVDKGVIHHDKLQAMVDELGVYKDSYQRKIKEHYWPKKSMMRYPLIGIKY